MPSLGLAYSVPLHDRLADALATDPALGVAATAALPDEAGLDRFRLKVYRTFAEATDPALRKRFLDRYPNEAAFSATAFKELFGSSAIMPTLGFDGYRKVAEAVGRSPEAPPAHYTAIRANEPRTLLYWIRIGSSYPDLDGRNQNRWWTVDGTFPQTRDGARIPFDPMILNMGRVEGLSGQAHAHYGLNDHPKSDDPDVLKTAPADFAVAAGFGDEVLTFAPLRAQAYGDLAVLARHFGEPGLAALYAGNAFHYLGDLGNQIHTIQIGIYDFFVDATIQVWKMKVLCLWGLRCEPPGLTDIGIDIISNHHTWLEEYFRIAVMAALDGKPLHPALADAEAMFAVDESTRQDWSALVGGGQPLMRALSDRLIAVGNEEGPEVYALARELTRGELRKAGVAISFNEVSDEVTRSYLEPDADDETLARFLRLQQRGLVRAATAMDVWWRTVMAPDAQPDWRAAADRLLAQQLDELEAAEARRAEWIEQHGGLQGEAR